MVAASSSSSVTSAGGSQVGGVGLSGLVGQKYFGRWQIEQFVQLIEPLVAVAEAVDPQVATGGDPLPHAPSMMTTWQR